MSKISLTASRLPTIRLKAHGYQCNASVPLHLLYSVFTSFLPLSLCNMYYYYHRDDRDHDHLLTSNKLTPLNLDYYLAEWNDGPKEDARYIFGMIHTHSLLLFHLSFLETTSWKLSMDSESGCGFGLANKIYGFFRSIGNWESETQTRRRENQLFWIWYEIVSIWITTLKTSERFSVKIDSHTYTWANTN